MHSTKMLRLRYILLMRRDVINQSMSYLPPANEVWGRVIFLHLSVILFKGVCLSACWDTTPRAMHTPGPCNTPSWTHATPPSRTHAPPRPMHSPGLCTTPQDHAPPPPVQSMLGDTVNVSIAMYCGQLQCILLVNRPMVIHPECQETFEEDKQRLWIGLICKL